MKGADLWLKLVSRADEASMSRLGLDDDPHQGEREQNRSSNERPGRGAAVGLGLQSLPVEMHGGSMALGGASLTRVDRWGVPDVRG